VAISWHNVLGGELYVGETPPDTINKNSSSKIGKACQYGEGEGPNHHAGANTLDGGWKSAEEREKRYADSRGAADQHQFCRIDEAAVLSFRVKRVLTRSAAVRTASPVIGETGGAIDRPGLREAARGTNCLDAAVISGAAGGTEDCGSDFARDGEAGIKKNDLKPWQKKEWCLGQINGEFLARMEEVLDLYEESYDPKRPVVCFDEKSCQLLEDMVEPVAMKPGAVRKEDYHYRRKGTANVLMACEPLAGERMTQTTEQRTA
jgi:hypothetical protein